MARIRSLKPEFWDSPGIETTDPYARLLFMAMWNWADDSGVGTANPRELLGFAFPLDEEISVTDLRRWLVEIRRVFGVDFYTVAGRPYYSIPSWEKHQKFDRRSKGKHPGPDQADTTTDQVQPGEKAPIRGIPTSPRRDSVAGTGEQGNRGTGEVVRDIPSPPARTAPAKPDRFDEFWQAYPRKAAKAAAVKAWTKAAAQADPDAIIAAAHAHAADPNREDQFTKYPATWLNAGCWEDSPLPARRQSNNSLAVVADPNVPTIGKPGIKSLAQLNATENLIARRREAANESRTA